MPQPAGPGRPPRGSLAEVARVFLKLGLVGFGGPAAHIALMEHELVRRRGWLGRDEFLDLVGAVNLIPGPNSTELAIHVGHRRAGGPGLLVAGACFILPSALMVAGLAWVYVRHGALPQVAGVLAGIQPVIIVLVLQALWSLGRTALAGPWPVAVAAGSALAVVVGAHELAVLAAAAGLGVVAGAWRRRPRGATPAAAIATGVVLARPPAALAATAGALGGALVPYGGWTLFATFLKIGSVLFGSGYVLLAFLRSDFVLRLGWITERQLLDAVAAGQITPGPLFTTATFVGYLVDGWSGAALATLGIFLPAFVLVALSGPLVPRLRRSPLAGAALDALNAASLALMGVVTWSLARVALGNPAAWGIAALALVLLWRFRVDTLWLVLGGALVGLALAP